MKCKSRLKSKTMWFNILLGITTVLGTMSEEIRNIFSEYASSIIIGIAVVGVVLRELTRVPLEPIGANDESK